MPIRKYSEAIQDPRFASAPPEEQRRLNDLYWSEYEKENPGDKWGQSQAAASRKAFTATAEMESASPLSKKALEFQHEAARTQMAVNNLDADGGWESPEQRTQLIESKTAKLEQKRQQLDKTFSLFKPEVAKEMEPTWKALDRFASDSGYFGGEGKLKDAAVLAGDVATFGYFSEKAAEDKIKYEKLRDTVATDFNLAPEEVDDVMRHRLNKYEGEVSRDAFGTLHFKDSALVKNTDEIENIVANSKLPDSVKAKAKEEAPQRVALFKENVVQTAKQNFPELAKELKLGEDINENYRKIVDATNKSRTSQAGSGAGGYGLGRLAFVADLVPAVFTGGAEGDGSTFGVSTAEANPELQPELERLEKISQGTAALSDKIQQDKVRIGGTDSATIGQGGASVIESVVLTAVTGGAGNLIKAERIARAGAVGKAILGGVKAGLTVAPTAAIYGGEQALDTYERASQSDDPAIRERAGELATKSFIGEFGITTGMSMIGLGGAEKIGAAMATKATRNAFAKSVSGAVGKAIVNFGVAPVSEAFEESLITAFETIHVQQQLNPDMTDEQVRNSIKDTIISTLIATGGVSGPKGAIDTVGDIKNILTQDKTTEELHDISDAEYTARATQENLPEAETAGRAFPSSGPVSLAEIERERLVQIEQAEDPEERASLETSTPQELAGDWGVDLTEESQEPGAAVTEGVPGGTESAVAPAPEPSTAEAAVPTEPLPEGQAPPAEEAGGVAAVADQPASNIAPRADGSVEPRPTKRGEERDLWDDTYGDMRKGGRSHNPDGTPYQPTVFDETSRQINEDTAGMSNDQLSESLGDSSETLRAQNVKKLINDGWVWDRDAKRFVNPANPSETPGQGLFRLTQKPVTTPTNVQNQPQTTAPSTLQVPALPTGETQGSGAVEAEGATPTTQPAEAEAEVEVDVASEETVRAVNNAVLEALGLTAEEAQGITGEDTLRQLPESDQAYLAAVEAGDMETAQRMVDEVARRAGYDVKGYHAGTVAGITEFKPLTHFGSDIRQLEGIKNRRNALKEKPADSQYKVFLKLQNPKRVDDTWNWKDRMTEAIAEGHDGLVYKNYAEGFNTEEGATFKDSYIPANPNQIKSADPVTYDADGNVIPLSERFNSESPSILYQGQNPKGQVTFRGLSEAFITYMKNADGSTAVHEPIHVARRFLLNRAIPADKRLGVTDDMIDAANEFVGAKDSNWTEKQDEKFARAFERYLWEGAETGNAKVDTIFSKIRDLLRKVYSAIEGSSLNVELTPEIKKLFGQLITRGETLKKQGVKPTAIPLKVEVKGKAQAKPIRKKTTRKIPAPEPFGVKREDLDKARKKYGIPEQPGMVVRMTDAEAFDEAYALMAKHDKGEDVLVGQQLVLDLMEDNRGTNKVEVALLAIHGFEIQKALKDLDNKIAKLDPGETQKKKAFETLQEALLNDFQDLVNITQLQGSKAGLALQAMKLVANQVYSVDAMLRRRAIWKNTGNKEAPKPLTAAEVRDTEKQSEKILDLIKERERLMKELEDKYTLAEAAVILDKKFKDVAKEKRSVKPRTSVTTTVVSSALDRLRAMGVGVTRLSQVPENKSDQAYFAAVEAGDMETAQRMVNSGEVEMTRGIFDALNVRPELTQRATTIHKRLTEQGIIQPEDFENGKGLIYGDGKGVASGFLGAESYEPFPPTGFQPDYAGDRSAGKGGVIGRKYETILNTFVLNVVDPQTRDFIVRDIANLLKKGGRAVIVTRGTDVLNSTPIQDFGNMSRLQKSGSGITYQKGFTQEELVSYLQDTLGEGFNVQPLKGGSAADVRAQFVKNTAGVLNNPAVAGSDIRFQPSTVPSDSAYLAAVEAGDMETAQRMVDEAARAAGYDTNNGKGWWHGSKSKNLTTFDLSTRGSASDFGALGTGFYFSPTKGVAEAYVGKTRSSYPTVSGSLIKAFLKMAKPATATQAQILMSRFKGDGDFTQETSDKTRDYLLDKGYDSVVGDEFFEEVLVLNPEQIKSADPVTYDADGKVIPLSQRFNPESPSILYQEDSTQVEILDALSDVGTGYLENGAKTLDKFTEKLVEQFGEEFRNEAEIIFGMAQEKYKKLLAKVRQKTPQELASLIDPTLDISERMVYNMALGFMRPPNNLKGKAVLDAVTKILQDNGYPKLTREEVVVAFTNYGRVKNVSQEQLKVDIRELKTVERLGAQLLDIAKGFFPKKTGLPRDKTTSPVRSLMKQIEQAMIDAGMNYTPEQDKKTRLAGARDHIKRQLENQLKDMKYAIDERIRIDRTKRDPVTDKILENLRERRKEMQAEYDAIFGINRKKISVEAQIKRASKMLDRQINLLEAEMRGEILDKPAKVKLDSPALTAKRERLEALREAKRAVKEALNPEKTAAQIATDRLRTSAQKSIERFEYFIKNGTYPPKADGTPATIDDMMKDLLATRDRLRDTVREIKKDQRILTPPEVIARNRAVRQLTKTIADLEARIAKRDFSKREKKPESTDPEVRNLKATVKSLRDTLGQMEKDSLKPIDPEEKRMQRMLAASRKRSRKLVKKLREKDFTLPVKRDQKDHARVMAAKVREAKLKDEFNKLRQKWLRENLKGFDKFWQIIKDVLFVRKVILLGGEFGVVLRQGFTFTMRAWRNPVQVLDVLGEAFFSTFSQNKEIAVYQAAMDHPLSVWDKAGPGMHFHNPFGVTTRNNNDDIFDSEIIDKIAKIKFIGAPAKVIGGIERFTRAFQNASRRSLQASYVAALQQAGGEVNKNTMAIINNAVMNATGRGSLKSQTLDSAATAANMLVISARYYVSRAKVAALEPLWTRYGREEGQGSTAKVRAVVLQELYFKTLTGRVLLSALMYGLAKGLGDEDDELEKNLTSSNFMKFDFKGTEIDITGGLRPFVNVIARMAVGYRKNSKGEIVVISGADSSYFDGDTDKELMTFVTNRLNVNLRFALDVIRGKNYDGDVMTPTLLVEEFALPIMKQDTVDIFRAHGPVEGLAVWNAMFLGASVRPPAAEKAPVEGEEAVLDIARKPILKMFGIEPPAKKKKPVSVIFD